LGTEQAARSDPAPSREQAILAFEDRRQGAEVRAALAQWELGNLEAGRQILLSLLERNPDCTDARELLVEMDRSSEVRQANYETTAFPAQSRPSGLAAQSARPLPVPSAEGLGPSESPPLGRLAFQQAVDALRGNDLNTAERRAGEGLASDPDSPLGHRLMGIIHYRRGNYRGALAAFQRSLELDNRDGLTYFLTGCTFARLGQLESAERHYGQARILDERLARGEGLRTTSG
jgi:tetratricopeptide (TPR) repeat protein